MSLPRLLELSLASNLSPHHQAGREYEIRELTNPFKRAGALAVHRLATRHDQSAVRVMQALLRPRGLRYIGYGADLSVYRQDDIVKKVDRRSVHLSPDAQIALRDRKRHDFAIVQQHLSTFLLDQQVEVDKHPLGEFTAVQTWQPYVTFDSLRFFTPNSATLDLTKLDDACNAFPGLGDSLGEFVDRSERMIERTDKFPDTNGVDNLVVRRADGAELMLIDSDPIGPRFAAVQQVIAAQLAALRTGLREVA